MDIQKYVNNQPEEPIFHSSAYARIAHGSSIGATDKQTFDERMQIHRNRQSVRRYGDSLIGRGDMKDVARANINNPLRQGGAGTSRQRPGGGAPPARGSIAAPRPNFREPPTRGYNPYG
jgi:hypothetical protein